MKKKSAWFGLIMAGLLLLLSSCDIILGEDGKDGKAYLKVTVDSAADAWYGYMEGFPDGWSLNTNYPIRAGEHDAAYALCEYWYYNSSDYYHYYRVNSYDLATWAVRSYNTYVEPVDALSWYLENVGDVFTNTFTFTVNSGTTGSLFQPGSDGQDKYYSLYLAWNPAYSTMSGNGVELMKAVSTGDDGSSLIEFRDDDWTFTMTVQKQKAPANVNFNSAARSVP